MGSVKIAAVSMASLIGVAVVLRLFGGDPAGSAAGAAASVFPSVTAADAAEPGRSDARARSVVPAARVTSHSPERPAEPAAPDLETLLERSPEFLDRIQPLMRRGTKMEIALEGFTDPVQFAAAAHAAHRLSVPFVLLKHRLLTQGKSLEAAIGELRPDVNASLEAERALAAARADVDLTAPPNPVKAGDDRADGQR